jgi:hypothetical protein
MISITQENESAAVAAAADVAKDGSLGSAPVLQETPAMIDMPDAPSRDDIHEAK